MYVYFVTAVVIAFSMLLLWLLSLLKRDASIVDIFWGIGFVLVVVIGFWLTEAEVARKQLITVLVVGWGLRLAIYLALRNSGKGEDFRYQAMRKRYGDKFTWVSLYLVFGLQGLLMWVISLPLQAAQISTEPDRLTRLDWLGVLLWFVGLSFEAIGDWQLSRFKSDPYNKGKVMDRGLWAYTRHPNYFGDAVVWWGFWLIACAAGAWWAVISPLLMTYLLMNISGVAMLEKTLVKTKPAYQDYVRRTSAFFPWFTKREV